MSWAPSAPALRKGQYHQRVFYQGKILLQFGLCNLREKLRGPERPLGDHCKYWLGLEITWVPFTS